MENRNIPRPHFVCNSTDDDRIFYSNVTGLFEQFIQQDNVIECGRLVSCYSLLETSSSFTFFILDKSRNISSFSSLLELTWVKASRLQISDTKAWYFFLYFTITLTR